MKPLSVISVAALFVLAGCSVPPDDANRVLGSMGFTDIELGGRAWFGCSEDDFLSSTFKAKGVDGKPVSGVVCAGAGPFAKGATVRLD